MSVAWLPEGRLCTFWSVQVGYIYPRSQFFSVVRGFDSSFELLFFLLFVCFGFFSVSLGKVSVFFCFEEQGYSSLLGGLP